MTPEGREHAFGEKDGNIYRRSRRPVKHRLLKGYGMKITARDLMTTKFHTLLPSTPVVEAVKTFKRASEEEQKRVFGMMVTNDKGRLVGMLSMYDILLFMRPKHIHIWGMMEDIDVTGLVDNACERARSVQVGDIMTTEVITITPETHVMMILDIMIKKHVRRIPVVENDKIHGIVYISDLFHQLLGKLGE